MSENANTEEAKVDNQSTEDVLPDWAREKLTKANNQAAKYRTEKKEAVEKAKQEVADSLNEKIEALEAQIAERDSEIETSKHDAAKLRAAIGAGIANDKLFTFADLLKGDDEDELASHAEELKKLFSAEEKKAPTQSATDPSQGSGGKTLPLNGDPLLESVMAVINKKL